MWKPSDKVEICALVDEQMAVANTRKEMVRTTFVGEVGDAWIDDYRALFNNRERGRAKLNGKPADLIVTGIVVDMTSRMVTVEIAIIER